MELRKIKEELEALGCDCVQTENAVVTTVTVDGKDFPVNFSVNEAHGEVVANCQYSTIGEFAKDDDTLAASGWWMLSQNPLLTPFALAALDTEDGLDPTDPIVLVDSRNFEVCDFEDVLGDLNRALVHMIDNG